MVRSRRHTAADAWGSLLRAHARLLPAMDAGVRRTGISLAYYDVAGKQWKADAGTFTVRVGGSSVDVPLSAQLVLAHTATHP